MGTRIKSDHVYDHDKYGEVLVTGIGKMYDEWDVSGPQDDIDSRATLVFYHTRFDGYGGMMTMPQSQEAGEFAKAANHIKAHEYADVTFTEDG